MGRYADEAQSIINDLESRRRQLEAKRRQQQRGQTQAAAPDTRAARRHMEKSERTLAIAKRLQAEGHSIGHRLAAASALDGFETAQRALGQTVKYSRRTGMEFASPPAKVRRQK